MWGKMQILWNHLFPHRTFCVYIRRGFALLGTVWLPECNHTFNLQSMPRGFQTAAWQINSIILLLIFNFYVKITYIVYLAYFLRFIFSASNFIKAIWQQNGNSVDCRIELLTLLVCPVLFLFVLGFIAVECLQEGPSHRSAARSTLAVMSALMAYVGAGEMRRMWSTEHCNLAYDPVSRWG